jgi:hypothetical protein
MINRILKRLLNNHADRRGAILPFCALCITAICGFVALSVDLGVRKTNARTRLTWPPSPPREP